MRSTENDVAEGTSAYLATVPGGEATIKAVKAALPKYMKLSAEDCAQSPTRKHEKVWEQQVRNIVSHRESPGNYIAEGWLSRRSGRLKITPLGRKRLGQKY